MTRVEASPMSIRVSAVLVTLLFGALLLVSPTFAADGDSPKAGNILQAALVGLGYYLSNSPWIIGQGGFFGLYRPLVAGFLVGIIFGDPVKGAEIGASINLLYIGFISAGGSIPADPSVAGWVGTALALAGNLDAGTAITLGVAVGLLGTIVFFTRMSVDSVFAHQADAAAERGDIGGVARANWVLPQVFLFIISFIPATLAVYYGAQVVTEGITWLNTNAPWVLKGFEIAGGLLPAIGIALNMRFIFRGSAIPFYFIGYVFAMLLGGKFFTGVQGASLGVIVVTTAVVGAAVAWAFVSIQMNRSSGSREA